MSTRTLVTKAATTLTAVQSPSKTVAAGHFNPADLAAINAAIVYDNNPVLKAYQSLTQGTLVVPGRGLLKVMPGDVVAVDLSGWPILVCGYSIAQNAAWTLT